MGALFQHQEALHIHILSITWDMAPRCSALTRLQPGGPAALALGFPRRFQEGPTEVEADCSQGSRLWNCLRRSPEASHAGRCQVAGYRRKHGASLSSAPFLVLERPPAMRKPHSWPPRSHLTVQESVLFPQTLGRRSMGDQQGIPHPLPGSVRHQVPEKRFQSWGPWGGSLVNRGEEFFLEVRSIEATGKAESGSGRPARRPLL